MHAVKDCILLEGSESTAFHYRIDGGMDERDRDEFESMDSGYVLGRNWPNIVSLSVDMHHRMDYMRKRNLGFSFLGIPDRSFESYLTDVDDDLPVTLAYMVADFYRNGTQCVSDLAENVTRANPAELKNLRESDPYSGMLMRFINKLGGDRQKQIRLEDCFFERIPADKFGCASISGDRINGYVTDLILRIVLKA